MGRGGGDAAMAKLWLARQPARKGPHHSAAGRQHHWLSGTLGAHCSACNPRFCPPPAACPALPRRDDPHHLARAGQHPPLCAHGPGARLPGDVQREQGGGAGAGVGPGYRRRGAAVCGVGITGGRAGGGEAWRWRARPAAVRLGARAGLPCCPASRPLARRRRPRVLRAGSGTAAGHHHRL